MCIKDNLTCAFRFYNATKRALNDAEKTKQNKVTLGRSTTNIVGTSRVRTVHVAVYTNTYIEETRIYSLLYSRRVNKPAPAACWDESTSHRPSNHHNTEERKPLIVTLGAGSNWCTLYSTLVRKKESLTWTCLYTYIYLFFFLLLFLSFVFSPSGDCRKTMSKGNIETRKKWIATFKNDKGKQEKKQNGNTSKQI